MQSTHTSNLLLATSENTLSEPIPIPTSSYELGAPLVFNTIEQQATILANTIETQLEHLTDILLEYESCEVANDEVYRTLDLLKNLKENRDYFHTRVGAVTSFLPRNQPLYALTCFVLIPSLMASTVHFRIPHSMRNFFPKVFDLLNIFDLFPNVTVSSKERIEFLTERSAVLVNPTTLESRPITDVVIFTGTSSHADQLRSVFDEKTLFISNGAGHNPVVVGERAHIAETVEAVLTLALYNQGQDCAAPNAILVHEHVYESFMNHLYVEFSKVKIGLYHKRDCRVGPISDPDDLKRIESLIVDNREWLHEKTGGVIRTAEAIVEPTIICKPLEAGGNYEEVFAPIIFVQKYTHDEQLASYFETKRYAHNAMYLTLYGESAYVENLIGRPIEGKILHLKDTFLHNTHLHAPGIERGTQPYGGYGYGASSTSMYGKITAMPTLPQRDIYEMVAKPQYAKKEADLCRAAFNTFTQIKNKNVKKILRLHSTKVVLSPHTVLSNNTYLDLSLLKTGGVRYVKIEESYLYRLLDVPNMEYAATLTEEDLLSIRTLKTLLDRKATLSSEEFITLLYAIPKKSDAVKAENGVRQFNFFRHLYQLLFKMDHGPRLGSFLWELKDSTVKNLLDIE